MNIRLTMQVTKSIAAFVVGKLEKAETNAYQTEKVRQSLKVKVRQSLKVKVKVRKGKGKVISSTRDVVLTNVYQSHAKNEHAYLLQGTKFHDCKSKRIIEHATYKVWTERHKMLLRLLAFYKASSMFTEARTDSFDAVIRNQKSSTMNRMLGCGNLFPNTILDQNSRHLYNLQVIVPSFKQSLTKLLQELNQ